MRSLRRAILAGGLGLAVSLIVAACGGSSGLLSANQSDSINGQLSQISSALQSGDCTTVSKATVSLARSVAQLPPSINATLRKNLDQGVSTVGQLANQQCKPASTPQSTTPTTSTTASTTSTTATTPTQTATSTPTTTSAPTTSTSSAPPATTPSSPGTTSTGSGGAGIGGGNSQGGGVPAGPPGAVAPGPPGGANADKGNGGKGK